MNRNAFLWRISRCVSKKIDENRLFPHSNSISLQNCSVFRSSPPYSHAFTKSMYLYCLSVLFIGARESATQRTHVREKRHASESRVLSHTIRQLVGDFSPILISFRRSFFFVRRRGGRGRWGWGERERFLPVA